MQGNRTVVGVDTAKRVFQLHWVDTETGDITDVRLPRAKFLEHFANRAPRLIGMEACGGTQHWARRLLELGHDVRLLPAKMVRPFVRGNKNDTHDARAIWTAVQQPGIKTVAVKSEEQQAVLALHRMRQRLEVWHRQNAASLRIAAIPGVGLLSATAAVATMGDPAAFTSGREFAAWLGLVPRHTGTGGRVVMLGISKRGDTYLRTLLIHGARSMLARAKAPSAWQLQLAKRRPLNVVAVAMANKTARTIWALLAHDREYEPNFVSQPA